MSSVATRSLRKWWPPNGIPNFWRIVARIATICLFIYWLAIFTGTHLPSRALPQVNLSDKLCHCLAFFGLAFLLAWAIPTARNAWKHLAIAGTIAMAYSCFDELTQIFIPGRSCDIWDVAADSVGVLLGLTCYVISRQILLQLPWGRRILKSLSR